MAVPTKLFKEVRPLWSGCTVWHQHSHVRCLFSTCDLGWFLKHVVLHVCAYVEGYLQGQLALTHDTALSPKLCAWAHRYTHALFSQHFTSFHSILRGIFATAKKLVGKRKTGVKFHVNMIASGEQNELLRFT